ncbi:hypothetical protein QFC22_000429 [Naganishia vaughanmartiniae]|uniref:Uncharacterized protein n=1 Tax=Naganishia vaughanmartiniae TaxID=1424756 RepID=A0ACC2XNA4_9TREE|nr:hypothetical protein QFC22_000429 [Naganishia vaughanmartiniae]
MSPTTLKTTRSRSRTSVASGPRAEMQNPSSAFSTSSSGASSPRRGRPRMPVVIMSSQLPRLVSSRLHPYSQLSQSPASPSLLPAADPCLIMDTLRVPGGFASKPRVDKRDKGLMAPVLRPQMDGSTIDEMPSPLLLPPRRAAKTDTVLPLRQLHANQQHVKSNADQGSIDLSGLNDKLGFHVPTRETRTPRGSDDEGETMLTIGRGRQNGKKISSSHTERNARSLCVEERARGRASRLVSPRNAVSAVPVMDSGIMSPSEKRGRSRDVKPCSRSTESTARSPAPVVINIETASETDTLAEDPDIGAAETAMVEDMLSIKETPSRPSSRLNHLSNNRLVHRTSNNRLSGAKSPRLSTMSPVQPRRPGQLIQSQAPSKSPSLTQIDHKRDVKLKPRTALVPPKPVRALSQKSCPTIVKHVANIFAPSSPASSQAELTTKVDGPKRPEFSMSSAPRRTASISLKRIQDQDLEHIMGSSIGRIPSPISSPRTGNTVLDTDATSQADLVEQRVLPVSESPDVLVHRNGPLHWLRQAMPLRKTALSDAPVPSQAGRLVSPQPLRAVSHILFTGAPQNVNGGSPNKGFLKRSRTASSATEGGDQKRHYTRWDGVETPITREDHPVHWAMLQRNHQHTVRKQGSKQSLKQAIIGPGPHSPVCKSPEHRPNTSRGYYSHDHLDTLDKDATTRPLRVVSLTSLAGPAVSTPTRPASHRHKSTPMPMAARTSAATSPADFLRSSLSHESLLTASQASIAGSFDSKLAYSACKGQVGYVNFDKVLGLDNHAAHEGVVVPQD